MQKFMQQFRKIALALALLPPPKPRHPIFLMVMISCFKLGYDARNEVDIE